MWGVRVAGGVQQLKRAMHDDEGVCLVLGSGGLKPLTSISLFEYLMQREIGVTGIYACSGGSLVSAAYAAGLTTDEIFEAIHREVRPQLFRSFDVRAILTTLGMSFLKDGAPRGFLSGKPLLNALHRVFGDMTFDDLKIPLGLQATNLETGEGVFITSGPVYEAVYATCCVYPLLPPLIRDGQPLVDGMWTTSLPIIEAAKRTTSPIIALNFSLGSPKAGSTGILKQSYALLSNSTNLKDHYQNTVVLNTFSNEIFFTEFSFEKRVMIWETSFASEVRQRAQDNLDRIRNHLDSFLDVVQEQQHQHEAGASSA